MWAPDLTIESPRSRAPFTGAQLGCCHTTTQTMNVIMLAMSHKQEER